MSGAARPGRIAATCVVAGILIALSAATPTRASITPNGQQGCAAGTVVGGPNLVQNGDFAQGSQGFTSQLPDRGTGPDGSGIYPDDIGGGGFSIQTGLKSYNNGLIIGRPFPGDPQRDVPPSQTYFYSNVNRDVNRQPLYGPNTPGRAMLWRQEVAVTENTTYNFFAYFDNLLSPRLGENNIDPKIELLVDGVAAGPAIVVLKAPDEWLPIQYSFTTAPGQTSAVLEIYDTANSISGDDFGMTQISLKQCVTSVGLAKEALAPVANGDGTYSVEYRLTLRNLGVDPLPLAELQVVDDLSVTFAKAAAFSVVSLTSPTLTVNASFNGTSDKNLLTGSDSLAAKATATITLRVRVTPAARAGGNGPFLNTAAVSARAGGIAVEDDSIPGTDPDPDNDGDPKEPGEDVATPVTLGGPSVYLPLVRQ